MKKDNSFYLNKELYKRDCIETAIKDYHKIAKVRLEENPNNYVCFVSQCKYGVELTIKEFCNYLIDIENSQGAM